MHKIIKETPKNNNNNINSEFSVNVRQTLPHMKGKHDKCSELYCNNDYKEKL